MTQAILNGQSRAREAVPPPPLRDCLYARKSSESEEKQVMSIDSQIKAMLDLAEKENLTVAEIRRESHSAKDTGQRPVYNELLADIRRGRFNAILTWAPDRLSRNAGDLGAVVDLLDQKSLIEIRTHGQRFTNSPNEKFMLMVVGSTAKLENDNKSVNVKRGMKTRVEMGLWPHVPPIGYVSQYRMDKKGQVLPDPQRAPIVKRMFERVVQEHLSGRKIYDWLKHEMNFRTKGGKALTLGGIFRVLSNSFYYGVFEIPKGSGNWYQGTHEPLITKALFDQARAHLGREQIVRVPKEFAFTKLLTCGLCGSNICAEEKYKKLKKGTVTKYIYYGCSRARDLHCKNLYIQEEALLGELLKILDQVSLDELGTQSQLTEELKRFSRFQQAVLGTTPDTQKTEVDLREYAKYLLKEGTISEKRALLANLKSRLIYQDKKISLKDAA